MYFGSKEAAVMEKIKNWMKKAKNKFIAPSVICPWMRGWKNMAKGMSHFQSIDGGKMRSFLLRKLDRNWRIRLLLWFNKMGK